MSASVSPNVYSQSSEHKTSALSPLLLTFLSSLLKNVSRYRIYLGFFFQFGVLTLRISPQLQQRRASQQLRQLEPDHRCRG